MSNDFYTFDAEVRAELGTGASRRLRRADKVPAILYGANQDAVSITLDHNKVIQAQQHEGFYTHILTLNLDGMPVEAIIKDIQRHPYKPKITHLDFQRVDANSKIHTNIPVHFVGEEVINKKGNIVVHQLTEIEITCLPKALPEFIEVNVSKLAVGDSLHLSDIKLTSGVTSVELGKGADHDQAVVTIAAPKAAPAEESEEAEDNSAE